jgi:hypothetical protein
LATFTTPGATTNGIVVVVVGGSVVVVLVVLEVVLGVVVLLAVLAVDVVPFVFDELLHAATAATRTMRPSTRRANG